MLCCTIFGVFDDTHNLIKEYKYWKLLIRNRTSTLGGCVAITKRHMAAFSEATPEEVQEFSSVVKDIEKSLKAAFNYDRINYLMLMMHDHHTHFHILPRYATSRTFEGVKWEDTAWPDAANLIVMKGAVVDQDYLNKVKKEILKHF